MGVDLGYDFQGRTDIPHYNINKYNNHAHYRPITDLSLVFTSDASSSTGASTRALISP